jgi:type IV pilus assembly protein PilV
MQSFQSKPSRRRAHSAGFAMIEVLVAILLFVIGILGLIGLQAAMTQAQSESKVRADAANLVDELSALMWSELGNKATIANLTNYTTGGCGTSAACTAWRAKLGQVLPGGSLKELTFDDTVDTWAETHGLVKVTLAWTLPNGGEHQYVATFNVAQNPVVP